jgi:hypothetical protein
VNKLLNYFTTNFFFHNSDNHNLAYRSKLEAWSDKANYEDLRVQLSEAHTRRAPVYLLDFKYLGTKFARITQAGRLKESK